MNLRNKNVSDVSGPCPVGTGPKKTPKYRKHSARNRGFVEIGGKRIYLPGAYDSPESKAAYASLCSPDLEPVTTIDSLIVSYLDYCLVAYSRGEYNNVRACARLLLKHSGGCSVNDFGPKRLRSFRTFLVGEDMAKSYVSKCVSITKRMFRWGASEEIIPVQLYDALTSLPPMRRGEARETKGKSAIPWKYVRHVCRNSPPLIGDMLRIQWVTGCRPGEVCSMQWRDIDTTQSPWVWRPSSHKNSWRSKALEMYLGPIVQRILLRQRTRDGYVFSPKLEYGRRFNSHYTNVSYRQAVVRVIQKLQSEARAQKKEPMPMWTPHYLRHSRLTRLRSRYGVESARASVGMAMDTVEIYAERDKKKAKKISNRF